MPNSDIHRLSPSAESAPPRASRAVAAAAAAYAICGGVITLVGWALDIQRLTDWNNDRISMFPNTAVCVALGGAALLLLAGGCREKERCIAVRVMACAMAIVGGLTLFEHISHVNLGIDTLLFNRPWGQRASTSPMRMGPPASTSFVILGSGLLLATYGARARQAGSALAILVMFIASLSLIGYWFRADQLFVVPRVTGIAWQSSTMLMALGIGLVAAVPEHGVVAALRRDDAGGTVMRRLIVPIVVFPLVLGWLRITGQEAGLYDLAFGTAVRTVVEILLFFALLWWTANGISKHASAAREAVQALREADRRKDEFLATLAHELRNPLAPIGNALQIIKHAEGDLALLRDARDTMQRQFGQMVRLVDDLLDVSRITRDKLELRRQRVELAPVIHQAVETCGSLAKDYEHEIRVSLPTTPIWLHADPVRLAQVFSNLLNNACKFTEPGGSISITAQQQGDAVNVSIKDTGIGISQDKVGKIFEMFEQVDKSLERTRGGLGIGLTLVKRLVELHGGRITAQSEGAGRGSEFIVSVPVASPVTEHAGSSASSADSMGVPACSTAGRGVQQARPSPVFSRAADPEPAARI